MLAVFLGIWTKGYCVSCWVGLALDSDTLNVNIHFSVPILGGMSTGEWYKLTTIQVPQNSLARTLVGYDSIHSHTEQWDQK